MRRLAPLVIALTVAVLPAPAAADVRRADPQEHLQALTDIAAQHGGNRSAGTPGYARSADYVAERLAAAGWTVTRQPVTFPSFEERGTPILGRARHRRDFVTLRFSGAGDVRGRVRVVVADGCRASSYRRVRRGDVAVITFALCSVRRAVLHAQRRGAAAVVVPTGSEAYPLRATLGGPGVRVPVVGARFRALHALVRLRGNKVRVKVDAVTGERTDDNVLAELPGGDRVVMAGGHLDSVPGGPGINLNGSGVALLLELAERLPAAQRGATVRLGFWSAEELGLHGSKAYVKALPAAERRRFLAYLNFDMVGSPRAVTEIYRGSPRLAKLLRRSLPGGRVVAQPDASDHAPFLAAKIPVGGVCTGSLERARGGGVRDRCYHRACDGLTHVALGTVARVATAAEKVMTPLVREG